MAFHLAYQFGAGPLILSWINEICSDDTEKRALLVAMGNDLAYVVQAIVSYTLSILVFRGVAYHVLTPERF